MTQFVILASLLLAIAYLLFLPALLAKRRQAAESAGLSLILYRQRRAELDQELAQGALDAAAHGQLCLELDRQLLGETGRAAKSPSALASPGRWPVLLVLLVVPFLAYGLYSQLGRPDLLDAKPNAMPDAKAIEDNIQALAHRLEGAPDDLQGWMLLARSYQATRRPEQAQAAYRKAMALAPDNLEAKALYAEALAEGQDNRLQGEPARIVEENLKADPAHPRSLWLAGLAAAERGDAKAALAHWQKLKAQYPADSEDAKQLAGYMAMLGGQPGASAPAAAKLSVKVKVSLAPSLAGKAKPDDTLFVFAKAASGPPMPLAIVRKQVKDLPIEVTLDDSMAMAAGMNLSAFPKIVLGARVSKSGQAMPGSGDLQGFSEPLAPTADKNYSVVIDQAVP